MLLQDGDQKDEDYDENEDERQLLVLSSTLGHFAQHSFGPIQAILVPVDNAVYFIQHGNMALELIADLHTQLPLTANRLS